MTDIHKAKLAMRFIETNNNYDLYPTLCKFSIQALSWVNSFHISKPTFRILCSSDYAYCYKNDPDVKFLIYVNDSFFRPNPLTDEFRAAIV